ncbi:MAG: TIGR02266 family protein [Polyangiales bacterium]|jgi:type IV pilus assembly protein PilZ
MSEGGRERRESGRAELELTVKYERLNALLSDYTQNICQGGTFIRTDRPLQVGTVLSFTIQAPQLEDGIVLRGVVRWVVEVGQSRSSRPAGMGIAFVYDSPDEKEAVEMRLDRLMAQALGPTAFEKLMGRPAPSVRPEDGSP